VRIVLFVALHSDYYIDAAPLGNFGSLYTTVGSADHFLTKPDNELKINQFLLLAVVDD
jgi:hypothetical protein